ncbi:MAG: hypothetical protein LRY66_17875 [Saccharospirillaceae bacterium]|nr:hypothetical protein [Saccharospirillaceae bacterium]MCD8533170.1 hypothetical protein [Saccharospirillaceae bacterium]
MLQKEYSGLNDIDRKRVDELFADVGGLGSLFADGVIDSGMSDQFSMPFDPERVTKKMSLFTRYYGQPRN